jgi:hypothetical protein
MDYFLLKSVRDDIIGSEAWMEADSKVSVFFKKIKELKLNFQLKFLKPNM